jgi:hypothetical protein
MDSLEDRIHKAGKHDEFSSAYDKFMSSKKTRAQQLDFYDKLSNWGASPEEADEFINMCMEG